MSAQREWPESPDGSFWVEWREHQHADRPLVYVWGQVQPVGRSSGAINVTAYARSQLGGEAIFELVAVFSHGRADDWRMVGWRVSRGSP